MSEHLCEFKAPSDKPKSDIVLYRINELIFEFEDYKSFFESGKISKEDFEKVKDFYGCL